jgi:hypothetical protein
MWMLAGGVWRDDSLDPSLRQPVAQTFCVISAIGQQATRQASGGQELRGACEIVAVSGGDQERQGTPQIICQRVDFGRAPAARAADRVAEGPPFAPAAERWTLMCVESIDIVPTMPVEPVRA